MAENDNAGEQKPKIIVDDDWKAQAKAEKERLAREVDQKQAAQQPPAGAPAADAGAGAPTREAAAGQAAQQQRKLPVASFASHVNSMVAQAFMAMGGMEDPRSKQRYLDLDMAKYYIDSLTMLEEKTQGNLSDDEKRLLDQGLYECRMQFVHVAQSMAEMAAPGAEFER